ncbi:MAG: hypothetical protein V7727_14115 [Sneathiella sp.]
MTDKSDSSLPHFVQDDQLAYERYRTEFFDNQGLSFDTAYRLAHLPLVAPDHPLVIKSDPNKGYDMGLHNLVYSVAMPLPEDKIFSSSIFQEFIKEISNTKLASKISWPSFEQRKNKLHATICSFLSTDEAPVIAQEVFEKVAQTEGFSVQVRGLFSGNLNVGRLYLRMYPEMRRGINVCHQIQKAFDKKPTDLYVVGILNLIDELDADEATTLSALIERWWDRQFVQIDLKELWMVKTRDDLVLDGCIDRVIPLV